MVIAALEQPKSKHRRLPATKSRRPEREPQAALIGALSIVAHDLRSPLASLQIMLELIETYSERYAIDDISGRARRAQTVIAGLDEMLASFLERVRLTGDPLAFRPRVLDLNDVAGKAVDLNQPLADARSIRIEQHGTVPVTLEGDRQLLLEAVDNILGNAVKYSEAGSIVEVTSGIHGNDAVVSIADQGPGITADELASLFHPFGRLAHRTPEAGTSTGLGLWIARLIATRHGGTLTVRPRDDAAGSVFTLCLPRWR